MQPMADSKKGQRQGSTGGSNLGLNDFARILKGMRTDRQARNRQQAARPTAARKSARPTAASTATPTAEPTPTPTTGRQLGYGVTDTGIRGDLSMPGSIASNIFKLNIPFSTEGVTGLTGNPLKNFDTGFQVVGDRINWQDPSSAGALSQYLTPGAINRQISSIWAMSSANPNLAANMAAFLDSGHAESLITGRPPGELDMTSASASPWAQQYAAANQNGATTSASPGSESVSAPTQDTKTTTPLAGKKFKNVKEAYRTAQETGQRFGTKDIRALGKATGKDMFDVVKTLREQKQKEGQTGGFLTAEAREKLRGIKESRQEREAPTAFNLGRPPAPSFDRKQAPAPTPIDVEKGRLASKVAQQSKVQRQEARASSVSQPRPAAPKASTAAPSSTSVKAPAKASPAPRQNVKRKI